MKNLILLIVLMQFGKGFSQKEPPIPTIWISPIDIYIKTEAGIKTYYKKRNKKKLNSKYAIFLERTIPTDTPIKDYYEYIVEEGVFKHGYKHGLWKTTYENKLVKTENYNNGLMVGRYRVFNTNGDVLYKTTFGPQVNGKYKDYYYTTGTLKKEGNYENGKKQGELCRFDEKGDLVETIHYDEGIAKEE